MNLARLVSIDRHALQVIAWASVIALAPSCSVRRRFVRP
jgi:hypothetical protein